MWRAAVLSVLCIALSPIAAVAGDPQSDLEDVYYTDQQVGDTSASTTITDPSGPTYDYGPSCGLGGEAICYEGAVCVDDGVGGVLYDVFLEGAPVGEICVTPQEAVEVELVTPGRVLRAFRSLTWPRSDLTIQPPNGETLVNFDTNFYTDNTTPSTQSVTLLGRTVLIEATPTTYTWHFGDGTTTHTADPGAAYPALDITHRYTTLDTFTPSLDTTYTGRYRLDGGPWVAIPETLTVPGAAQALETIEARPTLVDY